MKTIVLVRHPEKDGDKITAKGAMQAWAMALVLGTKFKFERFIHSGAHRALQALQVMVAALDITDVTYESNSDFHFGPVLKRTLESEANFKSEVAIMKEKYGDPLSLAAALGHSEYAREAREAVTKAILLLAYGMADEDVVLVVSHSPWVEMAMLDPASAPYGVGESDAVAYHVEEGVIVSSELIKAPLGGKTNT